VHEALDRGDKKIVLWGTGKPLREFLYSDDMAAACVHLLNLPVDSFEKIVRDPGNPPLINVGSGEEITISTLLEVVCKVLNYQGEIELDATKPDGTPRKLMDNSRMRSFGWKPEIGLEEGIGLAYAAFLNRS
jgi:GDP-L-fucose synthase